MYDVHIIVGLRVDQILPAKTMHSRKKLKSFCMCALYWTYPYPVSVSDFTDFFPKNHQLNKIVLKQVEENAKTK